MNSMKSWIHHQDVNGQRESLNDWNQINWKKVNKAVKSLRKRIFRARKLGYKSTKSGGLK